MPAQNHRPSSSTRNPITRRRFVYCSALAAGAVLVPAAASAAGPRNKSPNEKLNVAVVGAGGKGASDTDEVAELGENIYALCDGDENTLKSRAQKYSQAKLFRDYRKMLDEMYPWRLGRDGFEIAPNLPRRVWLGIETIDLADASAQPEQNARYFLSVLSPSPAFAARAQQVRQCQPEQPERADAQALTPRDSVALLVI